MKGFKIKSDGSVGDWICDQRVVIAKVLLERDEIKGIGVSVALNGIFGNLIGPKTAIKLTNGINKLVQESMSHARRPLNDPSHKS